MLRRAGSLVILCWMCTACSGTAVITQSSQDRILIEASDANRAAVSAEAERGCAFYGRSAVLASSRCLDNLCRRQYFEFTCPRLIDGDRRHSSPWLGISVDDMADHLYADPPGSTEVVLTRVFVDGPAWTAGLRVGDIIESLNGASVTSAARLVALKKEVHQGERAEIGIRRGWNRWRALVKAR